MIIKILSFISNTFLSSSFLIIASANNLSLAISRTQEIVSKNFLAFPTLRKPSQKIFWHFPHSGNRLKKFFGIFHAREIVSKNFLAFPALIFYLKLYQKVLMKIYSSICHDFLNNFTLLLHLTFDFLNCIKIDR